MALRLRRGLLLGLMCTTGACATGEDEANHGGLFGDGGGGPGGQGTGSDEGTSGVGSISAGLDEAGSDDGVGDETSDGDGGADAGGDDQTGMPCTTGEEEFCYTGPADTREVGACVDGVRSCIDGAWGTCDGQTLPSAETCNGVDDDCNGQVDDALDGTGESCEGAQGCGQGVRACVDGGWICQGNGQGDPEVCDGLDNDCDGQVDQDNPEGGASCETGDLGVCAAGVMTCVDGGLRCEPETPASVEQCATGLDEDCDGEADEGCGECAHSVCQTGPSLDPNCDPCVQEVCDTFVPCCYSNWDLSCVQQAQNLCGLSC